MIRNRTLVWSPSIILLTLFLTALDTATITELQWIASDSPDDNPSLLIASATKAVVARQSARDTLGTEARRQAVEGVALAVEQNYPWPDTAAMIAAHLRQRQRTGGYEGLSTLEELAYALHNDIRSINGDLHLGVSVPGSVPGSGPQPASQNHGIDRMERLDGDVGYLKLSIIPGSPAAFAAVAEALRSLDGSGAMILDVRGTPGGSAQMANFLISHFTPPDVLSLSVHEVSTGRTVHRHTLLEVPGPRRIDVPLYVLVDRRSASAAEDIPFVLQNLGRATVVGERTAGAGRNVARVPAGNGLVVSVSTTRVFDPATGREWERTGVKPDLEVASEEALITAHHHAISQLWKATPQSRPPDQL
jgi:retinol-binding protein 3